MCTRVSGDGWDGGAHVLGPRRDLSGVVTALFSVHFGRVAFRPT